MSFVSDLTVALRRARKTPGWSLSAIAGLSIAMGVGTTLFSVYSAVVFARADRESPEHVRVSWATAHGEVPGAILPPDVSVAIRDALPLDSVQLAGYGTARAAVQVAGRVRRARAERVTAAYFSVLGLEPLHGRTLGHGDELGEAAPVAVVSDRFLRELSLDPAAAVNLTIVVAGEARTLVGIVGTSFGTLSMAAGGADVWIPAGTAPVSHFIGRLRPGSTLERATAELQSVIPGAMRDRQGEFAIRRGLTVIPTSAYLAGVAGLIMCAVVLVVAAGSIASLLLAKLSTRQGEIALRVMLGASIAHIRRLLAAEVVVIVGVAGGLTLLLTPLTSRMLAASLPVRAAFAWNLDLSPDWRTVLFGGVVILAVGAGLVLAIARHATLVGGASFHADAAGTIGFTAHTQPARRRIIAGQVAGSAFLLILAGLFAQGLREDMQGESGLTTDGSAVGWIDHESQGVEAVEARRLEARVLEALRGAVTIRSAGVATGLPGERRLSYSVSSPGATARGRAHVIGATKGFADAVGLSLASGQWLTNAECEAEAEVVIDERGAEWLFPGQNPIGHPVTLERFGGPARSFRVVGVVRTANIPAGLPASQFFAYVPLTCVAATRVAVVARGAGQAGAAAHVLRESVSLAAPAVALYDVMPLHDAFGLGRAFTRLGATLLGAMGLLGVTIAFLGLYGVVSLLAVRRHREFAVRSALGATGLDNCRLMAAEGLSLIGSGTAAGIVAGVLAAVLIRQRFWQLSPLHWTTVAGVAAGLLMVGLVASVIPLARIVRRPLFEVLRAE